MVVFSLAAFTLVILRSWRSVRGALRSHSSALTFHLAWVAGGGARLLDEDNDGAFSANDAGVPPRRVERFAIDPYSSSVDL